MTKPLTPEQQDLSILDVLKQFEAYHRSIVELYNFNNGFTEAQRLKLQRYMRCLEKAREEYER